MVFVDANITHPRLVVYTSLGGLSMSSLAVNLHAYVQRNLPDNTLPDKLYHYTDINVLRNLFQDDQDLYAKHCSYFRGQGEIIPACKAFTDYLVRKGVISLEDAKQVNSIIAKKIATECPVYPEVNGMLPWISCFSSDGDSSCHWQSRAKKGNCCAIHFARETLDRYTNAMKIRHYLNPQCEDAVLLLPCYYIGTHNVDGLFEIFINAYKKDFYTFNLSDDSRKGCVTTIVLSSVMIKEQQFTSEKEWRLVRWLSDVRLEEQLSLRQKGIPVLQRNSMELPRECVYAGLAERGKPIRDRILGVTVSPDSMDRLEEVKDLFRTANIPFETSGERSIVRADGRPSLPC